MPLSKGDAPSVSEDPERLAPARAEHGVFGYTGTAVGGFGDDYSHQVADGAEPQAASDLPVDEGDARMQKLVRKSLEGSQVSVENLRVEVRDGVVTLFGGVAQASDMQKLVSCAEAVSGVRSVTNRVSARSQGARET